MHARLGEKSLGNAATGERAHLRQLTADHYRGLVVFEQVHGHEQSPIVLMKQSQDA